MLDSLLPDCRSHALALGCAGALDRVARLAAANGAARQRELVALNGRLDDLVASLADVFSRYTGVPQSRATILETCQIRQKGAAHVLCRWLAYSGSPILLRRPLRGGPTP
jgi:hypothetical protein